ncbi:MAG: EutP/PduV family microcompartment system protein [Clostridia bacterium]|nr:EutP/PduV family microcompartment system protein [Clostridia bacterium]
MRRLMLIGRSEAGKTTLTQAIRGEHIHYCKTQAIAYDDILIDTPGEYLQNARLGHALALYAYEADVVGLILNATEPFSLYPPNVTCMVNREVIGIVTKCNDGCPDRAENWLRLAGCERIFRVDSVTGEGIPALIAYLNESGHPIYH